MSGDALPRRARRAVIADDLTGAGDTGAQFARAGLSTRALVGTWTAEDSDGADVLVVSTDSRSLAPFDAAAVVRSAASALARAGAVPFFKKIDSSLRGQPGAEIDALMDERGLSCAVVCPAFPANGRVVSGGYLLVDGQPVARGAAGKDPLTPVNNSHVPTLLAMQTRRPIATCSIDEMYRGKLPEIIDHAMRAGALLVCDAVSDADLTQIAECSMNRDGILFAGAAGLANPVAAICAVRMGVSAARTSTTEEKAPTGKVVIVAVGSVNPVSRGQVEQAAGSGGVQVTVSPPDVFGSHASARAEALAEECCAIAEEGRVPLVVSASRGFDEAGASLGLGSTGVAVAIARALAAVVHAFCAKMRNASIVATGGDVALAILREFGSSSMDILGEVAPGIPVCEMRGGTHPRTRIVTKAGGFGRPEALAQAVVVLTQSGFRSCVR